MSRNAWRRVDENLLRFSTTELRDLYIAVLAGFDEAAALMPSLNIDEVRGALAGVGWTEPLPDDALHRALKVLTDDWKLLEAGQDQSAKYSTPEEFERRNLRWSLTPRGEAAIAGVLHAVDALRQAIGLQTAVLDAIADDLHELASLAGQPRSVSADGQLQVRLTQIERHMSGLIASIRQFNGHLQRLLSDDGNDDELFADVKRRTVSYLEEYVQGVERPQRRIASGIAGVEETGLALVLDRALTGANLAPLADGDPGPAWLAERRRRWDALRAWFAPTGAEAPLAHGLVNIARSAIVQLLRVLERRWDSRRRSASIADDFRALARLFAAAPGDDEAHRLFAAAFGIWPARIADQTSLDGEDRRPNDSWLDTEPAEVAPLLRTSGSVTNRGHASPIADPRLVRARRQREQAERLAEHTRLRGALATDSETLLSSFAELSPSLFAEFLSLLAVALAAPAGADGVRRAMSADGGVEVTLRAPADGAVARLRTSDGTFSAPDFTVSIMVTGAGAATEQEATGA